MDVHPQVDVVGVRRRLIDEKVAKVDAATEANQRTVGGTPNLGPSGGSKGSWDELQP